MNYELALKLKDAGFPQDVWNFELCNFSYEDETKELHLLHSDNDEGGNVGNSYSLREEDNVSVTKSPTLSELIEACGEHFYQLIKEVDGINWSAHFYDIEDSTRQINGVGQTPEEAVANLWLALNTEK